MANNLLRFIRKLEASAASIMIFGSLGLSQAVQEAPKDLTEIPLEELNKLEVYSASKFSQKVADAPASISIVTAADISRYGYRTIDDILRNITGFYVTNDRNYSYVGIRGFGLTGDYNSRALFLIDGHRLNDNIYGSLSLGTGFPISLDLIDRIEIVRGPGSSLYGTNAFFAVINIITKRGNAFNGGYVSAEAGSRQTNQGTATFGRAYNNGLEILLSSSYRNSKGYRRLYFPEFDHPENNNGIAEDLDTDRSAKAFVNISYRDFSAQAVYQYREKYFPTASFNTAFNDRRTQTTDNMAYLDLRFAHKFRNDWEFSGHTSINSYDSDGDYPSDYSTSGTPYIVVNRDIVSGRWLDAEAQFTRRISGKHHVTAGTEWRYGFRGQQLNYDVTDYYLYLDRNNKTTDAAFYLQGEWAAHENLLVSTGVRYDHYSTFGGVTNPRFAIVYSPWKKTSAKVLYGHAFRAPNLFELFYQDSVSGKANPNLQPESIKTLELVLEQHFGRKFRVAGSAYRYQVQHQITQGIDPADGLIVFKNSGSIHARGIELELEAKDLYGIDGHISYALQETEKKAAMKSLANSPRHIAQMNLFIPWFGIKGGTGMEMHYMSSRKTVSGGSVGGFFLANLTVLYKKLLPNMELSAGLYNIFNKRYSDPGGAEHLQEGLMQDGRSFRIRLGYGIPIK
jgi:outer membrane receptor for ferrienterochelin and colicins